MLRTYRSLTACCGYGSYGGWEDAILWFHAHLPSWLTGTVTVDVPATPEGEMQLMDMLPDLAGKTILISASTQYLLWKMLRDNLRMVDEMYVQSYEFPLEYGQLLRSRLYGQKKEIMSIAYQLYGYNEEALRKGVPPALRDEWTIVEMEPAAIPVATALVIAVAAGITVTVAVGIIVAGSLIYKTYSSYQKTSLMREGIDEVLKLGRPELVVDLLGAAKDKVSGASPWVWGLGIGAAAIGGTVFLAFIFGQIQKLART